MSHRLMNDLGMGSIWIVTRQETASWAIRLFWNIKLEAEIMCKSRICHNSFNDLQEANLFSLKCKNYVIFAECRKLKVIDINCLESLTRLTSFDSDATLLFIWAFTASSFIDKNCEKKDMLGSSSRVLNIDEKIIPHKAQLWKPHTSTWRCKAWT
jgi:hypothetical protein